MFWLVNEANQEQLLAFAQNWLYGDAEQFGWPSWFAWAPATTMRAFS